MSGETDVADFAFLFGFENRLHPALGGEDEFGIVVANHFVELQQIDGVGLQAAQRLVDLAGGAFAGAGVELGHQESFLAVSVAQGLAHADFAGAVVVVPAVVEEVDAFVERGANDANAFLLVASGFPRWYPPRPMQDTFSPVLPRVR